MCYTIFVAARATALNRPHQTKKKDGPDSDQNMTKYYKQHLNVKTTYIVDGTIIETSEHTLTINYPFEIKGWDDISTNGQEDLCFEVDNLDSCLLEKYDCNKYNNIAIIHEII